MNLYSPPFPLKGRPVKRLSSPLLPLPAVPSSDRSCICDILPQGKLCSAAFSTFYCSSFCRFLLVCKKTQKTSSIGHPWVATRPYMCSSILPQNSYGQTIFTSKSRNFVDSWTLQKPLFACFCYFFGKNLTVEKGVFTWGSPLLQLSDTNRGSCHRTQIICKYLKSVDFLFILYSGAYL